jgi:hypothetical protein
MDGILLELNIIPVIGHCIGSALYRQRKCRGQRLKPPAGPTSFFSLRCSLRSRCPDSPMRSGYGFVGQSRRRRTRVAARLLQSDDVVKGVGSSRPCGSRAAQGSDESAIHLDDTCKGASTGNTVTSNKINSACAGILINRVAGRRIGVAAQVDSIVEVSQRNRVAGKCRTVGRS